MNKFPKIIYIVLILVCYEATSLNALLCQQGYKVDALGTNSMAQTVCDSSFGNDTVCIVVSGAVDYAPIGIRNAEVIYSGCFTREQCRNFTCSAYEKTLRPLLASKGLNASQMVVKKCEHKCCEGDDCNGVPFKYVNNIIFPRDVLTTHSLSTTSIMTTTTLLPATTSGADESTLSISLLVQNISIFLYFLFPCLGM